MTQASHELPPGAGAGAAAGADTDLQAEVARELARKRRWRLGFGAAVEQRFEQDEGAARRRALVLAGLFGLFVYNGFLINDLFVRRDVFAQALGWRSVVTVYGGLVLLAVWRQWLSPAWREKAMASTLVLTMLCSCVVFRLTLSEARTYDAFAFSLVFLAGNISFPLRFTQALATSLWSLSIAGFFIVTDDRMPDQARIFAMVLMAGTALFTVQACHHIERSARLSYLLRLRETLASRAAERRADGFARLSQTDALTGLPNRRAFDLAMPSRWQQAATARRWLALVLIDIDNFKAYNDLYGHPAGDACLKRVAEAMRRALPPEAFLGRIGGEEFAALIEGDSAAQCQVNAERLRRAVESLAVPHAGAGEGVVTISLGLALRSPGTDRRADSFMASADAALYDAKHRGRNRWAQASNHGELPAAHQAG